VEAFASGRLWGIAGVEKRGLGVLAGVQIWAERRKNRVGIVQSNGMPKGKGKRRRWRRQNEERIKGRGHDKNEEIRGSRRMMWRWKR
jgi:hypothetical protein